METVVDKGFRYSSKTGTSGAVCISLPISESCGTNFHSNLDSKVLLCHLIVNETNVEIRITAIDPLLNSDFMNRTRGRCEIEKTMINKS